MRTKSGLEYLQRKTELFAKKEKLFQQKDISRWEISSKAKDIPKEHLLQDKKLAFDVMLSKVSILFDFNSLRILGICCSS